jgi:serine/threonine-protein kinase
MITGYLSLYLIFVIVISLIVGLLVLRLKLPSPRLIITILVVFVASPLLIGYLYLVYFNSLPEVIVPNVVGLERPAAEEQLADVDLRAREAGNVYESKYPEGFVVSQRPEAGRRVKAGRVVNLMINSGENKVPVPSLLGKPFSQAGDLLAAAQFRPGDVRWERHPDQPEGAIIAQEPLPGELAPAGSLVDLLVATTVEVVTEEKEGE